MSSRVRSRDSETEGAYANARILVADDQQSILSLVQKTVESRLHAHVVSVLTGDALLEELDKASFDVILTDMVMPGTSGFELLAELKQRELDADVIVMTGHPDDFPYVEVIRAGANDFINKPFPPTELVAKLIRVLDEQELWHQRSLAEGRYRSLFQMAVDGMALVQAPDLSIEDANQALLEILGFDEESLKGRPLMELTAHTERERFGQWFEFCRRTGRGMIADVTVPHMDGHELAMDISVTITQVDGDEIIFVSMKDVTEKRERDRRLAAAAERDELTGLFNRRAFTQRADLAIGTARGNGKQLSLMMIDLDNFKQVNDTLGHQVGDDLLKRVGVVVTQSIRGNIGDAAFRLGGDEFAVLLPGAERGNALVVAERMRASFENLDRCGTSMSIGVVELVEQDSAASLLRRADEALYKAKGLGKNTVYAG